MVAVPIPLPSLKPCKSSCKVMAACGLLFVIDSQTFHMNYNRPIPTYSPPPLRISTIFVHIIADGMCPSQNASFVTLASFSHCLVSGSFSLVASLSHAFNCSAFIPNGTHTCPICSLCTATAISSPPGGPSVILTGCTSIWISSSSGGPLEILPQD